MDFNDGVIGYGSEEPKNDPAPDVTLCPSVLDYRTVSGDTTSIPCTGSLGHPPPHIHTALDGSSVTWED